MGCNFYAIPKVTEAKAERIKWLLFNGKLEIADRELPRRIHIGKSSFGWRFLFNHNDWQYYGKTKASIKRFTKRCVLIDEYNNPVTHKDFWELIDSKQKQSSFLAENTIYYEMHDGFEFSTSTEFS